MSITFSDINELLGHLSNEIALIRGDALCTRFLAIYALHEAIKNSNDPAATLGTLKAKTIGSIRSVRVEGDSDDRALNEKQIERALQRCEEAFEELSRVLGLRTGSTH